MTVSEWHDAAVELRAAGLDDLADLYQENARLVRDGKPPVWPIPAHLRASARLAKPADPAPFVSDGREP